jgi:hypothetical protein
VPDPKTTAATMVNALHPAWNHSPHRGALPATDAIDSLAPYCVLDLHRSDLRVDHKST